MKRLHLIPIFFFILILSAHAQFGLNLGMFWQDTSTTPSVPLASISEDGLVMHLDAGDLSSYGGSGILWSDLMGNFDFNTGYSGTPATYPTFNGTAGNKSANEYFEVDGGDYFLTVGAHAGELPRRLGATNHSFTFEMWYYKNADDYSQYTYLWSNSALSGNWIGTYLQVNADNKLLYYSNYNSNGSNSHSVTGSKVLDAGWHNIIVTGNPGTGEPIKIYVNGELDISEVPTDLSWPTGTDSHGNLRMGVSRNGGGSYYNMLPDGDRVAIARMYNRVLSVDEVATNFAAQRSRFGHSYFDCPTGFIHVPGNSGLGTSDFCVMKYEARDNGNDVPVAWTATTPWTSISLTDAYDKCEKMGQTGFSGKFALMSNPEWMTIARNVENVATNWSGGSVGSGHIVAGHSDGSPNNSIAITDLTDPYNGTGNNSGQAAGSGWEQKRLLVLSNGETIWDMPGNVREYVDWDSSDSDHTLGPTDTTNAWREITTLQGSLVANDIQSAGGYDDSESMGQWYGSSNGGTTRGGSYGWSYSGIYNLGFNATAISTDPEVGFRCVYRPLAEGTIEEGALVSIDTTSFVPALTSDNDQGFVITSDTENGSAYDYMAFDGAFGTSSANRWEALSGQDYNATTSWLQIIFDKPRNISRIRMFGEKNFNTRYYRNYKIYYIDTNDNEILKIQEDHGISHDPEHIIHDPAKYKGFKIYIDDYGDTNTRVGEIQLFEGTYAEGYSERVVQHNYILPTEMTWTSNMTNLANVYDGNFTTTANRTGVNSWITVEFATPTVISRIQTHSQLSNGYLGVGGTETLRLRVLKSDDGINFFNQGDRYHAEQSSHYNPLNIDITPIASKFWRLILRREDGVSDSMYLSSVKFFEPSTQSGKHFAYTKYFDRVIPNSEGTAIESSVLSGYPSYHAGQMFDGDEGDSDPWVGNVVYNVEDVEWAGKEFNEERTFIGFDFKQQASHTDVSLVMIQVYRAGAWHDVEDFPTVPGWNYLSFRPTTGTKIRVQAKSKTDNAAYTWYILEAVIHERATLNPDHFEFYRGKRKFADGFRSYSDNKGVLDQAVYAGHTHQRMGQVIHLPEERDLNQIAFSLKSVGSPTGNIYAKIYNTTGTLGVDATPTSLIATSDAIDASEVTSSYDWYRFYFSTPVTLSGTVAIEFESNIGDSSNYIHLINGGSTSVGHGNSYWNGSGGYQTNAAYDVAYGLGNIHDVAGDGGTYSSANDGAGDAYYRRVPVADVEQDNANGNGPMAIDDNLYTFAYNQNTIPNWYQITFKDRTEVSAVKLKASESYVNELSKGGYIEAFLGGGFTTITTYTGANWTDFEERIHEFTPTFTTDLKLHTTSQDFTGNSRIPVLEVYTGTRYWTNSTATISGFPSSCKEILDAGNSTGDGTYMIDPDGPGGVAKINVYCDMTYDGGGWTLIAQNSTYSQDLNATGAVGHYPDAYYKLNNVAIDAIATKSSYWLFHGTVSNKRVKITTKLSTTNEYADFYEASFLVGNGTFGCGSLNWDGVNYIDVDSGGNKCWAYPFLSGNKWYDFSTDGNSGNRNGVGVKAWLR